MSAGLASSEAVREGLLQACLFGYKTVVSVFMWLSPYVCVYVQVSPFYEDIYRTGLGVHSIMISS